MRRVFHLEVNSEKERKISDYLRSLGLSKNTCRAFRREDSLVYLNGEQVQLSQLCKQGDLLTLKLHECNDPEEIVERKIDFAVVYEDEDILVVNKPSGIAMHPVRTNFENTLANGIAYYYREKGDDGIVFRSINRLDRYTSGLCLIAKNCISGQLLSAQVIHGKIQKYYLALAEGELTEKSGVIDAPIARLNEWEITRVVDYEKGQRAVTHYEVLGYRKDKDISLVKFSLETGRTHQIRVHMKSIGHPLIGDRFYNPDNEQMERQALHACYLQFTHPITKEICTFEAEMPEDMKEVWER